MDKELQDKCIDIQVLAKLDDKAWEKQFGNEGGLYGYIITLISKTVNEVIGKDEIDQNEEVAMWNNPDVPEYVDDYMAMERNQLRKEQRKHLAELLNKKEEN